MADTFDEADAEAGAEKGLALGIAIVAAALLLVAGVVAIFQGISALNNDNLLVITGDYIFKLDLTTWGWIHIVLGVLAVIIAGGLAAGTDWGRVAAIMVATISIIVQFLWLPHYPAWAILIIAIDVIIIWAAATWSPRTVAS